jgi:hypothetical protein
MALGDGIVGEMGEMERKLGSFWSVVMRSPMGVAGGVYVAVMVMESVRSDGTDEDGVLKIRNRFLRE